MSNTNPSFAARLNDSICSVKTPSYWQWLINLVITYNTQAASQICSDRFVSLGYPRKFQWVSRLGFVTAATSLNGRQPNFAGCLAVSWTGTLYIHFWGSCPVTEFCQVQSSFCVQVLRSPILAALLHDTRVVGVSQTAVLSRGRHLYSAGRPSRWALTHILVDVIY